MRVGREPLDDEAIRLLEQHNPDVTFDWPRLLKAASTPPAGPPVANAHAPRDERRRDRRDRRGRPIDSPPQTGAGQAADLAHAADVADGADFRHAADVAERVDFSQASDLAERTDLRQAADVAHGEETPEAEDPAGGADASPAADDAERAESRQATDLAARVADPANRDVNASAPVDSRYARLGADGLARLRARYADVRSRIEERPLENAERAELLATVERLNPDAWQTEQEVTHALEEYEVVFEALRPLVGRQPRSRRL